MARLLRAIDVRSRLDLDMLTANMTLHAIHSRAHAHTGSIAMISGEDGELLEAHSI